MEAIEAKGSKQPLILVSRMGIEEKGKSLGCVTSITVVDFPRDREIQHIANLPVKEITPDKIAAEVADKIEEFFDIGSTMESDRFDYNYEYGNKRGTREDLNVKTVLDKIAAFSIDIASTRVKEYQYDKDTGYLKAVTGYLDYERPGFALEEEKLNHMAHKKKLSEVAKNTLGMSKSWVESEHSQILHEEKQRLQLKAVEESNSMQLAERISDTKITN
jgi:hypothetical protein